MRTFSRRELDDAAIAWIEGRFSDEWPEWRLLAERRGIIWPPTGTGLDEWTDEHPSQRATLIRAIRETPIALKAAIARAESWADVVGAMMAYRDEIDDRLDVEDAVAAEERRANRASHREAVEILKAIEEGMR